MKARDILYNAKKFQYRMPIWAVRIAYKYFSLINMTYALVWEHKQLFSLKNVLLYIYDKTMVLKIFWNIFMIYNFTPLFLGIKI